MAAVVVGGAGALGSAIVRALLRRGRNLTNNPLPAVVSVDFRPCRRPEEEEDAAAPLLHSVVIPSSSSSSSSGPAQRSSWHEAGERVLEELRGLDLGGGRGMPASSTPRAGGRVRAWADGWDA